MNLSHFEIIGPKDVLHDTLKPSTLPIFSRDVLADDTTLARYPYSNVVGLSDADAVSSISDSDPLTFTTESSLIVDAGSPVAISEIRFAPRNACNIIVPGDVYSLYYYDSGWRFHSRQTAVFNFLEFDGVPEGTLYWVADETQGSEELPFSYENGAQHFINNYSPDRILKE